MTTWTLRLGSTAIVKDRPDFLSAEDVYEPLGMKKLPFWEALLRKHGRHPYLLVRYAIPLSRLCAGHALALLEEAREEVVARTGDISPEFGESIRDFNRRLSRTLEATRVDISDQAFSQIWVPVIALPVPRDSLTPDGHAEVQRYWTRRFSKGSELYQRYMRGLAIETNHIEGAFLMTDKSVQDTIRSGISARQIVPSLRSKIEDGRGIEAVLYDTLSAYDLVYPLAEDPSNLTLEMICSAHYRLLDTARFLGRYISIGVTRSVTHHSVYIYSGPDKLIQCCPLERVNDEMASICDLAQKHIIEGKMEPFALAAWLHLALVRCHPFDDGNGRVTRLIASIPLIQHGYPPISVPLTNLKAYHEAINQAYDGDFVPLAQCFLEGMRAGMDLALELDL